MAILREYFKKLNLRTTEDVLTFARRASATMTGGKPYEVKDPEKLKRHLDILIDKKQFPHFAPVYALVRMGHYPAEVARHLEAPDQSVRFAYAKARHHIATPQPRQVTYPNVTALFKHAVEVSRTITPIPRKPRKITARVPRQLKLSPLENRVAELAPRFKTLHGRQYNRRAITEEILGKPWETVDPRKFKKTYKKVSNAVKILKSRGLIETSVRLRAVKLREATHEEIERNKPLIHKVLRRGHNYLARDWRDYFTYGQAVEVAMPGLAKGIETYDPAKGDRRFHIKNWIAATITHEVRRERKHRENISMDRETSEEDERTLHEKIGQLAPDVGAFETEAEKLIEAHKAGKVKARPMLFLTLNRFGHPLEEIGKRFNLRRQRVHQLVNQARKVLEKT